MQLNCDLFAEKQNETYMPKKQGIGAVPGMPFDAKMGIDYRPQTRRTYS